MTVAIERPVPPAEAPLSPGHGASLATTAGITAVITGVMAVALVAQAPTAPGPGAALAGGAMAALAAGAGLLYEARNAVAGALDHAGAHPVRAARLAARGVRAYHLGMAAVFAGLALAAAWRLAVPLGGVAWAAPVVAGLAAARALWRVGR